MKEKWTLTDNRKLVAGWAWNPIHRTIYYSTQQHINIAPSWQIAIFTLIFSVLSAHKKLSYKLWSVVRNGAVTWKYDCVLRSAQLFWHYTVSRTVDVKIIHTVFHTTIRESNETISQNVNDLPAMCSLYIIIQCNIL